MDIASLIAGLTYAKTLAGLLVDERDRQKAAAIQVELTEKIIGAQVQLSEVLATIVDKDATIHRLTERNRDLEAAQREKERYGLQKVGSTGVLAYALRPSTELLERKDEPPHFICQICFDGGKKSVLQPSGGQRLLLCGLDKAHNLRIEPAPPIRKTISRGIENRW